MSCRSGGRTAYYFIFSMHGLGTGTGNTVGQLPGNDEQGIFSFAFRGSQLFNEF